MISLLVLLLQLVGLGLGLGVRGTDNPGRMVGVPGGNDEFR